MPGLWCYDLPPSEHSPTTPPQQTNENPDWVLSEDPALTLIGEDGVKVGQPAYVLEGSAVPAALPAPLPSSRHGGGCGACPLSFSCRRYCLALQQWWGGGGGRPS